MIEITSHKDFDTLQYQFQKWKQRFPMFAHDVRKIEDAVNNHMKNYMEHYIKYKQTKNDMHIDRAQAEIDKINELMKTVSKVELMALLTRG